MHGPMKTKPLRTIIARCGAAGTLLVGAYLLAHHAWRMRRGLVLAGVAAAMLTVAAVAWRTGRRLTQPPGGPVQLRRTPTPRYVLPDGEPYFWVTSQSVLVLPMSKKEAAYTLVLPTGKRLTMPAITSRIHESAGDLDRGWVYDISPDRTRLRWALGPEGERYSYFEAALDGTHYREVDDGAACCAAWEHRPAWSNRRHDR